MNLWKVRRSIVNKSPELLTARTALPSSPGRPSSNGLCVKIWQLKVWSFSISLLQRILIISTQTTRDLRRKQEHHRWNLQEKSMMMSGAGVTVNPSSFKHLYWQFKLHSVGKCCSSSPPRPAAAAASTLDGVQSLARFYLLETCCCETALFCFFFFFFVILSPQYGIEWTADGRAESTTNVSHCGSTTRSRKLNESPRNWRIIHTVH